MSSVHRLISLVRATSGNSKSAVILFIFAIFALVGGSASWALFESEPKAPARPFKASALLLQKSGQPAPLSPLRVLGNAHCRCDITCRAADGRVFTKSNSPFPGYTQGLESERNRCQSACNQWVGSSIQSWANEENICGNLSCSGKSRVGTEPSNKWKNVGGAQHNRTCCPAASNGAGCHPGTSQDIISVFKIVQTTDVNDPYRLVYTPSQAPNYEPMLQAYTNYLLFQRPNLHHVWAGYDLSHQVGSGWNQIGWGAVKFTPGASSSFTWGFFPASIQVNQTYRVWRWLFLKDVNDQDIAPFNDPTCTHVGFKIRLEVLPLKTAPGSARPPVRAIVSVPGQPDRTLPVEMETPALRGRRLQMERVRAEFGRPAMIRPDIEFRSEPGRAEQPRRPSQ